MRPLTEILLTKANFKYFSTLSMYREMPILTPEIPTRNSSACFCIFSSCIFNSEGVIKKHDAQPITHTSDALLMTIIGGVGTLIGPALGAGVLQLLGYWLSNTFGQASVLVIGIIYILLVLFVPYGIVGTWQQHAFQWRQGWRRLLELIH